MSRMYQLGLQRYAHYERAGEVQCLFFFSSRRRHTRCSRDWSSDVCSSDLLDFRDPSRRTVLFLATILALFGEVTRFVSGVALPDCKTMSIWSAWDRLCGFSAGPIFFWDSAQPGTAQASAMYSLPSMTSA